MGGYVEFYCPFCRYHEPELAIGHGSQARQYLALFKCDHCKTIGSAWVSEEGRIRCGNCYDTEITLLPDETQLCVCPRCGEQGSLSKKQGEWS